jgi:hypothetical protein
MRPAPPVPLASTGQAPASLDASRRSGDPVKPGAGNVRPVELAAPAPTSELPEGGFTLSPTDKTVAGAVRRWAKSLHYEVVWDAPSAFDAVISGEATLPGRNMTEALDQLLRGLKEKGYALEATLHANRVIRFTGPSPIPHPNPQPSGPLDRVRTSLAGAAEATLPTGPD